MNSSWTDRVVVITGASGGIGAALAQELAGRGARPVLVARSREPLEAVAAACGDALAVVADMTVRADADRVLAETLARFGRVDVWVNNVGRGLSRPIAQLTDSDLDAMVRDNVRTALYGMQVVLPVMQQQGEGVIANVSSMLSRTPYATFRSGYSAAKAALNSLTETLRIDLAETDPGIRVVTVLPGVVATDFGLNALGGGVDSRTIPGAQEPTEVARVVADGLLTGPVDLYTRPEGLAPVLAHLQSLARPTPGD